MISTFMNINFKFDLRMTLLGEILGNNGNT